MNPSAKTLTRLLGAACVATALFASSGAVMAQQVPKITKKVAPDFPGEAIRKGVDRGVLKARITVDGGGVPTEVAIVDTQPAKARLLNESVIEALNKWRFEGAGKPNTFELQVVLTAE